MPIVKPRLEPSFIKAHLMAHALDLKGTYVGGLWLPPDKLWMIGGVFMTPEQAFDVGYRYTGVEQ